MNRISTLALTAMLFLGTIGTAFAQHHHDHFNLNRIRQYTVLLQQNIEVLEGYLESCPLNNDIDHLLGDANEICDLTEEFSIKLHAFSVSKIDLRRDFLAVVDIAEHVTELIRYSHTLHSNYRIVNSWNNITYYMKRVAWYLNINAPF
jgi:hypothetical protein